MPAGWWSLPAVASMSTLAALALRRRAELTHALIAVTGAQLVIWVVDRRHTLRRPVLPTDLPTWLDRSITAAVFTGGLVVAAAALSLALSLATGPRRSPR